MGTNTNYDEHTEEELRIIKMISEGGLGVEAYYYYRKKGIDKTPQKKHNSKVD